MTIDWLEKDPNSPFPPLEYAYEDGLLAAGGDLSSQRLLNAYRQGIFPWFSEADPILWWSPDPRMVLFPQEIKISKSLRKTLKKSGFTISLDRAFSDVMQSCSAPRSDDNDGTWIHPSMIEAYTSLHQQGAAHSVEVWQDNKLVGGLYGVAIGHIFFGESMFSKVRDSSKVALVALCRQLQQWQFKLIDCQVYSEHLASLGARNISRSEFVSILNAHCDTKTPHTRWQLEQGLLEDL